MRRTFLILAALSISAWSQQPGQQPADSADFTMPIEDGNFLIQNARFNFHGRWIQLFFIIRNTTSSPWDTVRLRFDLDGVCNGERKQWSQTISTRLGWMGDPLFQTLSGEGRARASWTVRELKLDILATSEPPETADLSKCETGRIKPTLIAAENSRVRIDGVTGVRIDIEEQRKADAASKAVFDIIVAQEQAKKDAAEAIEQAKTEAADAARRKRLAAEQKKKDDELNAHLAKEKADEQARAAEERRKVRDACGLIYKNTADKKVSDLTVKEDQQVRACQTLGLYPPR